MHRRVNCLAWAVQFVRRRRLMQIVQFVVTIAPDRPVMASALPPINPISRLFEKSSDFSFVDKV